MTGGKWRGKPTDVSPQAQKRGAKEAYRFACNPDETRAVVKISQTKNTSFGLVFFVMAKARSFQDAVG